MLELDVYMQTYTHVVVVMCARSAECKQFLCTQLYDVSLVLETKLAETSSSVETSCLVKQAVL